MLTRSDWLETNKGDLHGHDETEKVEGHVGHVDPVCVVVVVVVVVVVGGGGGGGGEGLYECCGIYNMYMHY